MFALITLTELLILRPDFVGALPFYFAGIFCLTFLPLLAYPMQRFIPKYKHRGRDGQRSLAMIFSALGYVVGVAVAFVFGAPRELKMVFVEYLLCGISILVSSKVFKKKASGHACGVVGPVAMLVYLGLFYELHQNNKRREEELESLRTILNDNTATLKELVKYLKDGD